MASARDLTLEALSFIGVDSIEDATEGHLRRIARDLTATMEIIHSHGPMLYSGRVGYTVAGPKSVTLDVIKGSETADNVSDSYLNGSSIMVAGMDTMNQIADDALLFPYSGNTGTVSATIFGDAIPLEPRISSVIGRVRVNEEYLLCKLNARPRATAICKGLPQAYWIDSGYRAGASPADDQSAPILRLYPYPDGPCTIGFDVVFTAPRFNVADLGTDEEDSTKPLIVASNYVDSLVRPIFLQQWSAGPYFRRENSNLEALKQNAALAMQTLQNYRIQKQYSGRMTASY